MSFLSFLGNYALLIIEETTEKNIEKHMNIPIFQTFLAKQANQAALAASSAFFSSRRRRASANLGHR